MKNALKNSVRLTGYLGSNPAINRYGDNKSLARVSLATSDYYKNKEGEWVSETQWHNLVMWGKQAAFAERSLFKGNEIAVEGKLVNRSYVDKNGIKRYTTDIIVNEVISFNKEEKQKELADDIFV